MVRQRRERPALADRGEHDAGLREERCEQEQHEKTHGKPARDRPQLPALHPRVGEGAVVLDRHIVARDQHEHDGEHHEQRRYHDTHAKDAAVDELRDVEVSLHREQVLHSHDQGRDEVGEGPDEDEQRSGNVAGSGQG